MESKVNYVHYLTSFGFKKFVIGVERYHHGTVIGAAPTEGNKQIAQIILNGLTIRPNHCAIRIYKGTGFIRRLSKGGVIKINGEKIKFGLTAPLTNGDQIKIGLWKFEYHVQSIRRAKNPIRPIRASNNTPNGSTRLNN